MILICGLGNPETKSETYRETRHNIGFLYIDYLLQILSLAEQDFKKKFQSLYLQTKLFDQDVILMKPQGFMNNSGTAIYELCHFYKIPVRNIIIIHDELDLNFTTIKSKFSGGHAGHNGLRDIHRTMTNKYYRIRIGISHPKNSENPLQSPADYVISKFSIKEKQQLAKIFDNCNEMLQDIILKIATNN